MDPNLDERNMATLAQSLGCLTALPVWLMWRNRSAFVRAHARQSIAFDGVTLAALVIIAAFIVAVAVGGNAALSMLSGSGKDMARLFLIAMCTPGIALVGFLAVMAVALGLRLRAAMAANQGRPFHYPLLKGPPRF
jgi:uncharacterized Tic20 family protein